MNIKWAVLAPFNLLARIIIQSLPIGRMLSEDNYIRLAYRLILKRKVDRDGFAHHKKHMTSQQLPGPYVFEALSNSSEYKKKDNPLNYVRTQAVQKLDHADVIVDLGGSTKHMDEGALFAMGYKQKWKRLIIVDLPSDERHEEWQKDGISVKKVDTPNGPVEYIYGSFADPDIIKESGFVDMVWAGNSIEHITESEADSMLEMVGRILKPYGVFCLDTPNRRITEKVYGDKYTHDDHKIEYTHSQLSEKIKAHGFEIVDQMGVLDCKAIMDGADFENDKLIDWADFTPNIEDGFFLFYMCAKTT